MIDIKSKEMDHIYYFLEKERLLLRDKFVVRMVFDECSMLMLALARCVSVYERK